MIVLLLGMFCLETKKSVLVPLTHYERRQDLPLSCARRKNTFAVEISQVAFSGPERRVWRDKFALVLVSITRAAVEMLGRG